MRYLPDSAFDFIDTRKVPGLPEGAEPVVFTPLGYADNQSGLKKRKSPADIVNYKR
jgi:nitroreductase